MNVLVSSTHDAIAEGGRRQQQQQQQQNPSTKKPVVGVDSEDDDSDGDGLGSGAGDYNHTSSSEFFVDETSLYPTPPKLTDDSLPFKISSTIRPKKTVTTPSSTATTTMDKKNAMILQHQRDQKNPFKEELQSPLRTLASTNKDTTTKKKNSWSKSMSSSFSSLRKIRFGSNNSLLNGSSNSDLGSTSSTKNALGGMLAAAVSAAAVGPLHHFDD